MQCHPSLCTSCTFTRHGTLLFAVQANVFINSFWFLIFFKKNADIFLRGKFFYLSTVSRITLSLAVNFQSDALRDLVPFVQVKKRVEHP